MTTLGENFNIDDLKTMSKEEIFLTLRNEKIFSSNLSFSVKYNNLLTIMKDNFLLFSMYAADSFWLETYKESRQNATEYFFNINSKNITWVVNKSFLEVYYALKTMFIDGCVTYEDLRQRVIYLYENNILKSKYENKIQEIDEKINNQIKSLENFNKERVAFKLLLEQNDKPEIEDRLLSSFKILEREIRVTNSDVENLKNVAQVITQEMDRVLYILESEYKLAIKLGE